MYNLIFLQKKGRHRLCLRWSVYTNNSWTFPIILTSWFEKYYKFKFIKFEFKFISVYRIPLNKLSWSKVWGQIFFCKEINYFFVLSWCYKVINYIVNLSFNNSYIFKTSVTSFSRFITWEVVDKGPSLWFDFLIGTFFRGNILGFLVYSVIPWTKIVS